MFIAISERLVNSVAVMCNYVFFRDYTPDIDGEFAPNVVNTVSPIVFSVVNISN